MHTPNLGCGDGAIDGLLETEDHVMSETEDHVMSETRSTLR